jgi:low affinity Fe/Cu permease
LRPPEGKWGDPRLEHAPKIGIRRIFGSVMPLLGTSKVDPACPMMAKRLQQLLTNAGAWLSRPWVVGIVLLYVALWFIFDPGSFGWHGVATTATLLMTLFIQRSEHRDTQAIHAKLDELLRANGEARNQVADLDDKEPEQVEEFRSKARRTPF